MKPGGDARPAGHQPAPWRGRPPRRGEWRPGSGGRWSGRCSSRWPGGPPARRGSRHRPGRTPPVACCRSAVSARPGRQPGQRGPVRLHALKHVAAESVGLGDLAHERRPGLALRRRRPAGTGHGRLRQLVGGGAGGQQALEEGLRRSPPGAVTVCPGRRDRWPPRRATRSPPPPPPVPTATRPARAGRSPGGARPGRAPLTLVRFAPDLRPHSSPAASALPAPAPAQAAGGGPGGTSTGDVGSSRTGPLRLAGGGRRPPGLGPQPPGRSRPPRGTGPGVAQRSVDWPGRGAGGMVGSSSTSPAAPRTLRSRRLVCQTSASLPAHNTCLSCLRTCLSCLRPRRPAPRASSSGRSLTATSLASSRPRTVRTARAADAAPAPAGPVRGERDQPGFVQFLRDGLGRHPGRRPQAEDQGFGRPLGRCQGLARGLDLGPLLDQVGSNAPGSARSTIAGPCRRAERGANGPRNRRRGTRPGPSRGGCGRSAPRAEPSWRSRTTARPASLSTLSARRYLSAWSSSSGWRAGSPARGVPGSTVKAYALTWDGRRVERQHALQRGTPVAHGLTGGAEDQVDAVRPGEAGLTGEPGGARRLTPGRAPGRATASTCGTIDWAPKESLVTPPAR